MYTNVLVIICWAKSTHFEMFQLPKWIKNEPTHRRTLLGMERDWYTQKWPTAHHIDRVFYDFQVIAVSRYGNRMDGRDLEIQNRHSQHTYTGIGTRNSPATSDAITIFTYLKWKQKMKERKNALINSKIISCFSFLTPCLEYSNVRWLSACICGAAWCLRAVCCSCHF